MAQDLIIQVKGLYTNVSDIAGAPRGALKQALNIDISKDNIAQPRRGSDLLAALPDSSYRASALWDYQNYIYAWANNTAYNYVSGAWVSRGTLTKNTNAAVPRTALAANNLYVLASDGLKKTDLYTTNLYDSGLKAPLAISLTQSAATGTAVVTGKTVNYRALITKTDANSNQIYGPVSNGQTYSNSSGATKDTCAMVSIPSGLAGTETIQLYRSIGLTSPAVSDEGQQCYEYRLNAANVTATAKTVSSADPATEIITATAHTFQDGTIVRFTGGSLPGGITASTVDYVVFAATTNTFKIKTTDGATVNITSTGTGTVTSVLAIGIFDVVPDELLGATIYTAPSQNGISQSNTQAPLAADMCVYQEFLFLADVQGKQSFIFSLISSGGTGLAAADTITIGSEVYTAGATASYGTGSGTFVVDTASASASTRVDNTARSMIDVINRSSLLYEATLVYTDSSSLPGKIRLTAKSLSTPAFTVVSTKAIAFSPQLPSTATASTTSTADTYRNGLRFSRQGLPEAHPEANIFRIGSADDPIVRILPLRDALLIFKRKDGTYVLRGNTSSNFSYQVLDSTARVVASESLVVVNGQVYGLFEAGICRVSDTAVEIISDPIKDKLDFLFGTALDQIKAYSVGVSYEQDNKYILAIPESSVSTYGSYQIVYDIAKNGFTEWDQPIQSGHVFSYNKKLYIGKGNSAYVSQERKNFDNTDFADYLGTRTIISYAGTLLTISGGVDSFNIGDLLSQGAVEADAYITAIDLPASTVKIDYSRSWTTGTADVDHYSGINCVIEWNPIVGDNPAGFKHFAEMSLIFRQGIVGDGQIDFFSDTTPALSSVAISGTSGQSSWGVGSWGEFPWGGETVPNPIRIGVPRPVARCNSLSLTFNHRVAWSDWQLQGIAPLFYPTSTRISR